MDCHTHKINKIKFPMINIGLTVIHNNCTHAFSHNQVLQPGQRPRHTSAPAWRPQHRQLPVEEGGPWGLTRTTRAAPLPPSLATVARPHTESTSGLPHGLQLTVSQSTIVCTRLDGWRAHLPLTVAGVNWATGICHQLTGHSSPLSLTHRPSHCVLVTFLSVVLEENDKRKLIVNRSYDIVNVIVKKTQRNIH